MSADHAFPNASPIRPAAAPGWGAFFRAFVAYAGPYWSAEGKWRVHGRTAALVALTVAQVGVAVAVNAWYQRLFDALERRDLWTFLVMVAAVAAIVAANVAIVTTHLRVKRRLQLGWRDWMTRRLGDDWMAEGRHYRVTLLPADSSNPDGRIAEDIRIATEIAFELGHSLLYAALMLVSFVGILWQISGPIDVQLGTIHWSVPGYLVWAAIAYAVAGTWIAQLLGRPLVRAADRRQTAEADFRFGLASARENSRAIALMRGEGDERRRFAELFAGVRQMWDRQTDALANLFLFTASWSVLTTAVPILAAAPQYIAGAITLGVLMQSAQAFQQVVGALAWPVDNMARVAEWRASADRVMALDRALGGLSERANGTAPDRIDLAVGAAPALRFAEVVIADPDGTPAIGRFSAAVEQGDRVLIDGDGAAAARLFNAVAGLAPWGSGRIELPADGPIFFLPQHPYLPFGTLRGAVCYPSDHARCEDAALCDLLRRVGLGHLVDRRDEAADWGHALTDAEEQRLGIARAIVHRPRWLFLQEATDALDAAAEERLMGLLLEALPEATVVTIGFQRGLEAFHPRRFTLVRSGREVTLAGRPTGAAGDRPAA